MRRRGGAGHWNNWRGVAEVLIRGGANDDWSNILCTCIRVCITVCHCILGRDYLWECICTCIRVYITVCHCILGRDYLWECICTCIRVYITT